jgi:hypothetical protein
MITVRAAQPEAEAITKMYAFKQTPNLKNNPFIEGTTSNLRGRLAKLNLQNTGLRPSGLMWTPNLKNNLEGQNLTNIRIVAELRDMTL